jgi:hypothetical protein
MEARDVSLSAALGHEPPARPKGGVEAGEQLVVVWNPVEDRIRERGVDRRVQHELGETGLEHGRPLGVEGLPCVLHHRGRRVNGDDAPARQPLEQHLRDPSRSTAGVEHGLVAAQGKALQHPLGPLDLRCRDAIVGGRVPLAGHASWVVTGPERSRSAS